MKKLIGLILLLTSLSSCGPSAEELAAIQKAKSTSDSTVNINDITPGTNIQVIVIADCEYIIVTNSRNNALNIIHKYNCKNHIINNNIQN